MGWANELYAIYELNCKRPFGENETIMVPLAHKSSYASLEVTLDMNGNFKSAAIVDKKDAETIHPVTTKSDSRTSNAAPHPLHDRLSYLAGDYNDFVEKPDKKLEMAFQEYIQYLEEWKNSEFSHPALHSIFAYLSQKHMMKDLIDSNIILIDPETGFLDNQNKVDPKKGFVRFIIQYDDDLHEQKTWKDHTLYDSFIGYYSSQLGNKQLCYATGQYLPAVNIHPSGIRSAFDQAKLISSNDKDGFTYRGRFANSDEALSLSYDFSQKMHIALKWLANQKNHAQKFEKMILMIWASGLQPVPNVIYGIAADKKKALKDRNESLGDDDFIEDTEQGNPTDTEENSDVLLPDTMKAYKDWLAEYLRGFEKHYQDETKIMVMGIESAIKDKGRLSIGIYDELKASDVLKNMESWYEQSACIRYDAKNKRQIFFSYSLYKIIESAYGREYKYKNLRGEMEYKVECFKDIFQQNLLRLLPCVMNGRPVPQDLIRNLVQRASRPLAYDEKGRNHNVILNIACGMIRLWYIRKQKGDIGMGYDPTNTDRSYLFGCLLAIADKAERDTYSKDDKSNGRITNARKYWTQFSQRPAKTWAIIESKLQPYLNKRRNKYSPRMRKLMNEMMAKMPVEDFNNDSLSPLYLIGYHHFMDYMYTSQSVINDETAETDSKEENTDESVIE